MLERVSIERLIGRETSPELVRVLEVPLELRMLGYVPFVMSELRVLPPSGYPLLVEIPFEVLVLPPVLS